MVVAYGMPYGVNNKSRRDVVDGSNAGLISTGNQGLVFFPKESIEPMCSCEECMRAFETCEAIIALTCDVSIESFLACKVRANQYKWKSDDNSKGKRLRQNNYSQNNGNSGVHVSNKGCSSGSDLIHNYKEERKGHCS